MFSVPLPHPIRVLLVDDQRAILAGVSELIQSESPRMTVVGQARSASQALALADATTPDVVVLDADLAGENGLDLIPHLRAARHAAVVLFTCLTDPELPGLAFRQGATAVIAKTAPSQELLDAISAAAG